MFITDKNLLIGTTEVTQKQWKDLMSYNPSRFVNDSHPVENVSLKMVQEFINKLNQIEGANVYRLPTEPEYTQLISPSSAIFNDIQSDPNKSAWLKANSNATTHRVGLSNPLSKGLFDIIGNVWEWTSTVIHAGSPATAYEDNPRICFGGSWRDENVNIDTLTTNYPPDFRHEHLGFRLVVKIPKNK
jgi:formylglycine-generating enzyme required for sulfatase activity